MESQILNTSEQQGGHSPFQALRDSLLNFQNLVNTHKQIPQLIKGWDRDIRIEATNSEAAVFTIEVREQKARLFDGRQERSTYPEILLRGNLDTLENIFRGDLSPAEAYFEGQLECYASDQDQVKLDAISLMLWGI